MQQVYWWANRRKDEPGRMIAKTIEEINNEGGMRVTQTKCSTKECFEKNVTGFGIVPAESYRKKKFYKKGAEIFFLDVNDPYKDINALKRALRTYIASFAV